MKPVAYDMRIIKITAEFDVSHFSITFEMINTRTIGGSQNMSLIVIGFTMYVLRNLWKTPVAEESENNLHMTNEGSGERQYLWT